MASRPRAPPRLRAKPSSEAASSASAPVDQSPAPSATSAAVRRLGLVRVVPSRRLFLHWRARPRASFGGRAEGDPPRAQTRRGERADHDRGVATCPRRRASANAPVRRVVRLGSLASHRDGAPRGRSPRRRCRFCFLILIRERASGVPCPSSSSRLLPRGRAVAFPWIDARSDARRHARSRRPPCARDRARARRAFSTALRELVLEPRRKRDTVQKKRSIRVALGASAAEAPVDVRVSPPPRSAVRPRRSLVGIPERPAFRPRPPSPDAPVLAASSDSRMFLSDAAFGTAAGDFGSGSARWSPRRRPRARPRGTRPERRRDAMGATAARPRYGLCLRPPRRRGDRGARGGPKTFRIVHPR